MTGTRPRRHGSWRLVTGAVTVASLTSPGCCIEGGCGDKGSVFVTVEAEDGGPITVIEVRYREEATAAWSHCERYDLGSEGEYFDCHSSCGPYEYEARAVGYQAATRVEEFECQREDHSCGLALADHELTFILQPIE